jgi:hypothetical protein
MLLLAIGLLLPFAIFSKLKKAAITLLIGGVIVFAGITLAMPISRLVVNTPEFTPVPVQESAPPTELISIADYRIIFGEGATPAEINAANILADYLSQITGLAYVAEQAQPTGSHEFLIGQISGVDVSHLGEEGFMIKAEGESIIIAGGRPRGTIYGVFRFLEEYFDCRWYTRELHVIPERAPEIAPVTFFEFVPVFEYRQTDWLARTQWPSVHGYVVGENDWLVRHAYPFSVANGINDNVGRYLPEEWGGMFGYQGPFCHTLASYFVARSNYFESNPEWFAWRESTQSRNWGQLCLTYPEVLEKVIEEVLREAELGTDKFNGERFIISVTHDDNRDYCQCPACAAIDEEEGSQAGTMIRFVNAVAEAVEEAGFTHVLIDTFAYTYTRTPPRYAVPRDNVLVRLCSIECCFAHSLDDPNCPTNGSFADDIRRWSEISNHLYVWNYNTNYSHFNTIFPNFHVKQANVQFFAAHNVVGVYEQGNHRSEEAHSSFNALSGWLNARLMFNPDLDFDAEVSGFLQAYYGNGWQYIREFIDIISANAGTPTRFGGHRRMHIYISPTDPALLSLTTRQIRYADMLWARALELADNEMHEQNLRRSQLSWRFWKGCNQAEEFSRWQLPGLRQRANRQLFEDFEAFGIVLYAEPFWHACGNSSTGLLTRPRHWRGTPESWRA